VRVCDRARALRCTRWERTIANTESIIHNLRRATRETVTKLAPCIICPRRYSWRTYVVQLRVSSAFCTGRTYIYIYIYISTHAAPRENEPQPTILAPVPCLHEFSIRGYKCIQRVYTAFCASVSMYCHCRCRSRRRRRFL